MDFREMNYMMALARYQSVTRAAESLMITQPALSKALKSIEQELGVSLFNRVGGKYVLTGAGECYIRKAGQILLMKKELDAELREYVQHGAGILRLYLGALRCSYMLPETLPAFKAQHPLVDIRVTEGISSDASERLLEGAVDIAFFDMPSLLNPGLKYEVLNEEHVMLCAAQKHRFANKWRTGDGRVSLECLREERLIALMPEQRSRQIVDGFMAKYSITPKEAVYTSNLSALMGLVEADFGVALMLENNLKYSAKGPHLASFLLAENEETLPFCAMYRKDWNMPEYARHYIELVKSILNQP